jgi:hypothetical protein
MILKRAHDRYKDIKTAESRLRKGIVQACESKSLISKIQDLRYAMASAEISQKIMERAYGHSQTIAILHDVRMPEEGETINHILIDAEFGKVYVINAHHIGGIITQKQRSEWIVHYGREKISIEDPRIKIRRQIDYVKKVINSKYPVVGICLLPQDAEFSDNENKWIHLIKSNRFEAWIADSRGLRHHNYKSEINRDELIQISNLFSNPAKDSEKPNNIEVIETVYGKIKIKPLGNGYFAIKNDYKPELVEEIIGLVKGRAVWNSKYKNWIVSLELMNKVREHFSSVQKRK